MRTKVYQSTPYNKTQKLNNWNVRDITEGFKNVNFFVVCCKISFWGWEP